MTHRELMVLVASIHAIKLYYMKGKNYLSHNVHMILM